MIVERREGESTEKLLSRFKLVVQRSGVLREAKRKRHFTSKSETRRLARARAVRKIRKNARQAEERNGHRFRGGAR
jgi:small subunit ribosomal protein S21